MNKRWERRSGNQSALVFARPDGTQFSIPAAPVELEKLKAYYAGKGNSFVRVEALWEPVSATGAHLPGDREVDIDTGDVRVLTQREGF